MARKRIKTLAHELGVSADAVLRTRTRLNLPHAQSDAALLSMMEMERVKTDLNERSHRAAVIRRETLVETSAGTVEKRLNDTVMAGRRHAEPHRGRGAGLELFHFEVEKSGKPLKDFVAPMFEEPATPPAFYLPGLALAGAGRA